MGYYSRREVERWETAALDFSSAGTLALLWKVGARVPFLCSDLKPGTYLSSRVSSSNLPIRARRRHGLGYSGSSCQFTDITGRFPSRPGTLGWERDGRSGGIFLSDSSASSGLPAVGRKRKGRDPKLALFFYVGLPAPGVSGGGAIWPPGLSGYLGRAGVAPDSTGLRSRVGSRLLPGLGVPAFPNRFRGAFLFRRSQVSPVWWVRAASGAGDVRGRGCRPSKPKPRWDVHLPGAGNRGGSLAGVFRPLIAGPSGSAV